MSLLSPGGLPHQLIRFVVVGGVSALVNLAVFSLLLTTGVSYLLAAVLAYLAAFGTNFVGNRTWVFQGGGRAARGQLARLAGVALCYLGMNSVLLLCLIAGFGVDEVIAQAIALILLTPLTFLALRSWVF